MCFWHDYDSYPSIVEKDEGPEPAEFSHCEECGKVIHKGEFRSWHYQQEYDPDETEPDEDEPSEGEFDPGQTCEWTWCESCLKILNAIGQAELDEGCKGDETQPGVGGLREALQEDFMRGNGRYADYALRMFPEVAWKIDELMGTDCRDLADDWSARDLEPVEVYGGEG